MRRGASNAAPGCKDVNSGTLLGSLGSIKQQRQKESQGRSNVGHLTAVTSQALSSSWVARSEGANNPCLGDVTGL